jgi:hypothetical protein
MTIFSTLKRQRYKYGSRIRNLIYHFRSAEWSILQEYQSAKNGKKNLPWLALIYSSWVHGTSFADYYRYRFFEKNKSERSRFITTSLRHELTLQLNDPVFAEILRDKVRFSQHFRDLLGREAWTWSEVKAQPHSHCPPRLVIKHRRGQQGEKIYFPEAFINWSQVWEWALTHLDEPENYLFEAWLNQHPVLAALNPESVNTIRLVTCLNASEVDIWCMALRVGAGPGTDHFSNGGLGIALSSEGFLLPPAVRKNPFSEVCERHPITGHMLSGFQLPYVEEIKALARQSALRIPQVRSVGWDIAVRPEGPCLIEGNNNWGAHVIQIPRNIGLRHLADEVCDMYLVYD